MNGNSSRREFLYGLGASLGSVAFSSLLASEGRGASPLAPKPGHFPAQAKQCIFLMMDGGPSHIDTFDPKPKLADLHLQRFTNDEETKSAMLNGDRYYVASPFRFKKAGASGADIAENWVHLESVVDDICFYRGCQVESVNHPTAMYQMNTGNRFGGDPAIGAWTSFGLGTLNQDLPAFIVLPEITFPQGGPANWSQGFLPANYQGTPLRPQGSPILDLHPLPEITPAHQRENLDLLQTLNRAHQAAHPEHDELAARMETYELAFRMQSQVPGLLTLGQENQQTLDMYGIGQQPTDAVGRRCLLARRLVEKGVRFVQVYAGSWDSHEYIAKAHGNLIQRVDKPITGLLTDLKQRNLLDSTLVIWCGEFGRSPDNGIMEGASFGRDHNPNAMAMWFAGGGVRAGHTVGATDELGAEAVECVHHVRDVHVTILRLLGLDDNKLTYFHGGRFKQLSQFGGEVIDELIA